MLSFLYILQSLGWLLYAGPMLAFAILVWLRPSSVDSFQKWGVGFGLALAVWIYTSISIQYIQTGSFYPDVESNPWMIAAFVMWISNIKLEIWTLDPIRKKNDQSATQKKHSFTYLQRHLVFHALSVMTVHVLFSMHFIEKLY